MEIHSGFTHSTTRQLLACKIKYTFASRKEPKEDQHITAWRQLRGYSSAGMVMRPVHAPCTHQLQTFSNINMAPACE